MERYINSLCLEFLDLEEMTLAEIRNHYDRDRIIRDIAYDIVRAEFEDRDIFLLEFDGKCFAPIWGEDVSPENNANIISIDELRDKLEDELSAIIGE